MINTALYSIRF